ncbi:recombinase family protein [Ktedonospora formicarum]|uniref:DNA recombinase n=1 Tax=Ktedonospora formicarum TaxID=2778364 RepID=A0A8J3IFX8_9CHLR|nr:recombinase family protein [Ktedonospora formicarum]GHO50439.1 DNA recombinase [Ktedonospora formicarum]
MDDVQVGIYARVSSEQQSDAKTIESQISELRARVAELGVFLPPEHEFIDDGYSGATLIRPALERLRDVVAAGGLERLFVHCPDRLARNYAHQVLLLEEFLRAGVEVSFLNREVGQTPEDQLLLQVQGMISEYERAKIMERSRRGKRHAAQVGAVSVLSGAPYGYRYVRKHDGAGEARFEVVLEEARVVRQVFTWVGRDRCSIGEVCRRLTVTKEQTRTGKTVWDRATVRDLLHNPAYKGAAAFGKTHLEPLRPRLRAQRGRPLQPRRAVFTQDVPREDWLSIPVPALVDEALFEAVQEQLSENQQRARIGQRGVRYLLQGLLVCHQCGYAYYGKAISPSARKGHPRAYAYCRCIGADAYRFGGVRLCWNKQVRTDLLEEAVWNEVCTLLSDPSHLEEEYRQRLQTSGKEPSPELRGLLTSQGRLRQGIARLIDSYAEGTIEKAEFEPRIKRLRERIAQVQEQIRQIQDEASLEQELRLILGRLETFAVKVKEGLHEADWLTRREIIRTLVKRVEIDEEQVHVIFRVGPQAPPSPLDHHSQCLHYCGRSERSRDGAHLPLSQEVCFSIPLPKLCMILSHHTAFHHDRFPTLAQTKLSKGTHGLVRS